MSQLRSMGLEPQVQEASAIRKGRRWRPAWGSTLRNIVARFPGTGSGPAILLVSHYDSAPGAPGAADDGASVAAMLETLRALRTVPPPKRDIIFLFTDGEECGLLGARAFVEEHPWAREAGVVLNFENRGNRGPVVMFETSDESGWLIHEFARAVARPVASSLTDTIYRHLPNDTDLTVFREAGLQGLNFACIDGVEHYHAATDTPDRLDPRTLQHHGSYMLGLARRLANADAEPRREGNVVYFDVLGRVLIAYSERWVGPLTVVAGLAFVGVVAVGLRNGAMTPAGVAAGLGVFVLTIPAAAAATWILARVASGWSNGPASSNHAHLGSGVWLRGVLILATLAVSTALYAAASTRIRPRNQAAGALLGWLVCALLVACYLPGASHLTLWPLLFSTAALGGLVAARKDEPSSPGVWTLTLLAAVPGVLLFAPLIWLMYIALEPGRAFVVSAVLALLLGSLTPLLRIVLDSRRWLLPGITGVACLICLAISR